MFLCSISVALIEGAMWYNCFLTTGEVRGGLTNYDYARLWFEERPMPIVVVGDIVNNNNLIIKIF